ncbi:MAG: lanthionine synthetase LanC family protein, partial [Actinoallomurus sp.]
CAQDAREGDLGAGWCSGSAGLLMARACLDEEAAAAGTEAAQLLAERPVLGDLSLCHGELGIAEAVLVLATVDPSQADARTRRRHADLVLDAVQRHGPTCATPGGIATPGLMHGLAGIGYGLLRLGFPQTIPSVLLLEPTPASGIAIPSSATSTDLHDGRTIASTRKG